VGALLGDSRPGDVLFRLTMLRPQPLSLVLALVLALVDPLAAGRYLARVQEARPLLAFRGASLWLAANSRPGELVFHAW
jgi:hypothetical protein